MSFGPIFDAALNAQAVSEELGLKFFVIGGVALQRWGEPRFTADADLSVLAEPGREDTVASALEEPEILEQLERRIARIIGAQP